jgi:uncharacterized protein YecE (DUF72 family)
MVGCCGFPTSMKKYFENFSLVELNSTFYQYPRTETVEGWRKKAPETFEFTVKAHQDISHKEKMKITNTSLQAFEKMKKICQILNSKTLLIQTPGSFRPDRLEDAEKFFRTVDRDGLVLVWETRGSAWETLNVRKKLGEVLEKLNVVHVTDPFRLMPAYLGEIAYFRLHGLGKQMYYYQYSDVELRKLKELVVPYAKKSKDVYVFFNNLSMFEDGLRFMRYLAEGTFPKIPSATGLASIREIVEKTRYPITRNMLIRRLGWRLVKIREEEQAALETFLKNLPSRTYRDVEELIKEIKSVNRLSD